MQIEKLASFSALCETGSVSQCAEKIHISQQGLSRQIKSMEEELGVRLFERSTRGMTLTKEGQILRPYFEQAYRQYEQGILELKKMQSDFRMLLRVAVCPGIQHAVGLEFFIGFQRDYPQINLDFYFAPDAQCEQDLLAGKADAAFLDWPEHASLFHCYPVVRSRCVAVVRKDHPFAAMKSIHFSDLKGMTVYIPDQSHRKTIQFEKAYPEVFRSIHFNYASNEYESYFTLPKYFDGVGLTFHFLCDRLDPDLVEVPVEEESYVFLVFCSCKSADSSPVRTAVASFTEYVKKKVPTIIT